MSTEERPQPRFRLFDTIEWVGDRGQIQAIAWDINQDEYYYDVRRQSDGRLSYVCEGDHLKLVSRDSLAEETPRQKADRLKQEANTCDDKSWYDKEIQAREAELAATEWERSLAAASRCQRPDGAPTTEAAGNAKLLIGDRRRTSVNRRAPDPQIESLKADVVYLKELIRAIGTLCAAGKGER